ncbi:hypothetical protein [Nocardia crassostreae]|uniref:hypothetical protein n=1 Tax=Nocardia crassostreae TaxID=53428 RepID=UPI000A7A427D|nr:hypothetical protein [Nocardia crassostreae]
MTTICQAAGCCRKGAGSVGGRLWPVWWGYKSFWGAEGARATAVGAWGLVVALVG